MRGEVGEASPPSQSLDSRSAPAVDVSEELSGVRFMRTRHRGVIWST